MKRTAVKTISAFDYQSDFTPPSDPSEADADTVQVTASELAELLANARNEGLSAAQIQFETTHSERLKAVSGELTTALDELMKLAACLDDSLMASSAQHQVRQMITAACTHIVTGQRDLFADQ